MATFADIFDRIVHRDRSREDTHELSAAAQRHIHRNAAVFVGANGLQNIGDQAAKASTVLPWLMAAIGAPTWMTGLLVPIRESGSMLPQAALQPWVLGHQRRRGIWIAGALGQAIGAAVMAMGAALLSGWGAGLVVLGGLTLLALARSLTSIASKDIQGRTMPKGMRGRIGGLATMLSGIVAITIGVAIRITVGADTSAGLLAAIVAGGSGAWLLAAALFTQLREDAHRAAPNPRDPHWFTDSWQLVRTDAALRRFVIVRALLLVSALAPPFIVHLSATHAGAQLSSVATFIIASGASALVGGRISGLLSDRSARKTMIWGAGLASTIIVVFLSSLGVPALMATWWWGPLV
ncbi:MAG: hypothetical protein Q4Q03_01130, partial [Bowdeniella nasicola]|nr:hypothetical protein [Bowdeniella nasicola]